MRITLFALFLFLPPLALAGKHCPENIHEKRTSPCTPDRFEQGGIMLDIRAGVEAHDKYEIAFLEEKRLREELLAILNSGGVLPPEKEEEWKDAIWKRDERKRDMDYKLNLALKSTREKYGLGQEPRDILNGPLKGYRTQENLNFLYAPKDQEGRYKPVYVVEPFPGEPHKAPHVMIADFKRPEDGFQAYTLEDGSVVVGIEAFRLALAKGSPRLLAKTLYHEVVHIRQLGTPGWENRSQQEMEAKARVDTFANLEPFDLPQDEKEAVELNMQEGMFDYREFRAGRQSKVSPFTSESQRTEFAVKVASAQADFEVEDKERVTLEEGFASALKAVEDNRRQRQDADEKRQQEGKHKMDERNRKTWEKTYNIRWELLKALTLDACKDPTAFRKYYKNTVSPETRIPENLLLQKLKEAKNDHSLNACQKEVIAFFIASDGPVLLSQAADVAWKSISLGDPFKAVTGFFRSIQDKLKSTPGPSGPGGSDPDEQHGGGNQGGSAPGNLNGPAYGQLKGIAGGRNWP